MEIGPRAFKLLVGYSCISTRSRSDQLAFLLGFHVQQWFRPGLWRYSSTVWIQWGFPHKAMTHGVCLFWSCFRTFPSIKSTSHLTFSSICVCSISPLMMANTDLISYRATIKRWVLKREKEVYRIILNLAAWKLHPSPNTIWILLYFNQK